ncbi:hypothetical protein XPR_2755 [Xanthomonas arboricola pv. pruni MAFF 301420]|uniref:Uncharacterized protein n=2 Tax=Xanthomonas arboricola pv. pruni TaxID=69929 RepID=W4SHP6_9XANT|nr:hypothetical protein XPU_2070 [Xanthomonas arboricola pv. pruni str. MAFF 311562]GAE56120.1 hypothetical protein XPR_2755 [Xanthomonas arboricola pv. pruni MAFF 301420]GAE58908.1 hypothetical protein XPN_0814 [Xanthomonas arboricola pv. pruni MAFF 301427]
MERRPNLIVNEEQVPLLALSFEPPFHLLHGVNEVTAGMQRTLPSTFALRMRLGIAVLSDRLLEAMELVSHVGPTVTEAKAMNRPYALFI